MSHKLNSAVAEIGVDIGKNSFDVAGQDKRDEMHSEASSSSQPSIITRDQGRRGRPRVPSGHRHSKGLQHTGGRRPSRELCSARFLLSRCPLWVKTRDYRSAPLSAASPLEAAITRTRRHSHFVPFADVSSCSKR
jgi:hypothetical protein